MSQSEFERLSGLKKGKQLGSGIHGKVYAIKNKPRLVVKQQSRKYFRREVPFSILLSRKSVIPKLRGVYQGKKKWIYCTRTITMVN